MTRIAIAAALALAATTTIAGAHERPRTYGGYGGGSSIDRTQAIQQHRIEQGRRTGSLTVFEAYKLRAEQARIAALERRAKADGHLSHAERARIVAAQRHASRHIYQETHDAQRRGNWGGWWRR